MEDSPGEGARLAARAQALIELKCYADALPLIERAIALGEDSRASIHCLHAVALRSLGDHARALRAAERGAAADPSDEWPQRVRCAILLTTGKKREALRAAQEAIRLAPLRPECHLALAKAYLSRGRLNDAQRTAEELLHLAPTWANSHALLGDIAMHRRRYAAAEHHYREALTHDPRNETVTHALGSSLHKQGKRGEALDRYHDAVRIAPANAYVQENTYRAINRFVSPVGSIFGALLLLRLLAFVSGALALALFVCGAGYLLYIRRSRLRELRERYPSLYTYYRYRLRLQLRTRLPRRLVLVGLILVLIGTLIVGSRR